MEATIRKSRWTGSTKEDRVAHAKKMSEAYWGKQSVEARAAHMERARAGKRKPLTPEQVAIVERSIAQSAAGEAVSRESYAEFAVV